MLFLQCVVISLLTTVLALNPGLRIRITQDGLNYANDIAVDLVSKKVKTSQIPNQSGDGKNLKYELTDLVIRNFIPPQSHIQLASESDLLWKAANIGLEVDGKFSYKYRKIIKISGHGTFNLKFSDMSFSVGIQIGADTASGKPTVKADKCSCNSGHVKIKFSGKWSWIYNLFSGIVEKKISKIFQEKMCAIIQNLIDKDAEKGFSAILVEVPLGQFLTLDYRLLAAPFVTSEFIEGDLKGEIFWNSDKTEASFTPEPMATITDNRKMIYITLSDYVFNTLTYQAHKHNMLVFNLTSQNIKDKKGVLNTTCSGICIGKLIPQIAKTYPNSTVELQMKITEAPVTKFTQGAIGIKTAGDIKLYARKSDKSLHYLFELSATATCSANLTMRDETLYGAVGNIKITTNVSDSAIGPINEKALQFLVDSAIKITITPMINDLGQKGFELPSTDNLKFIDSDFKLLQNTILIETNLKYIPESSKPRASTSLKFVPKRTRYHVV